jgi:hypothetical protein
MTYAVEGVGEGGEVAAEAAEGIPEGKFVETRA